MPPAVTDSDGLLQEANARMGHIKRELAALKATAIGGQRPVQQGLQHKQFETGAWVAASRVPLRALPNGVASLADQPELLEAAPEGPSVWPSPGSPIVDALQPSPQYQAAQARGEQRAPPKTDDGLPTAHTILPRQHTVGSSVTPLSQRSSYLARLATPYHTLDNDAAHAAEDDSEAIGPGPIVALDYGTALHDTEYRSREDGQASSSASRRSTLCDAEGGSSSQAVHIQLPSKPSPATALKDLRTAYQSEEEQEAAEAASIGSSVQGYDYQMTNAAFCLQESPADSGEDTAEPAAQGLAQGSRGTGTAAGQAQLQEPVRQAEPDLRRQLMARLQQANDAMERIRAKAAVRAAQDRAAQRSRHQQPGGWSVASSPSKAAARRRSDAARLPQTHLSASVPNSPPKRRPRMAPHRLRLAGHPAGPSTCRSSGVSSLPTSSGSTPRGDRSIDASSSARSPERVPQTFFSVSAALDKASRPPPKQTRPARRGSSANGASPDPVPRPCSQLGPTASAALPAHPAHTSKPKSSHIEQPQRVAPAPVPRFPNAERIPVTDAEAEEYGAFLQSMAARLEGAKAGPARQPVRTAAAAVQPSPSPRRRPWTPSGANKGKPRWFEVLGEGSGENIPLPEVPPPRVATLRTPARLAPGGRLKAKPEGAGGKRHASPHGQAATPRGSPLTPRHGDDRKRACSPGYSKLHAITCAGSCGEPPLPARQQQPASPRAPAPASSSNTPEPSPGRQGGAQLQPQEATRDEPSAAAEPRHALPQSLFTGGEAGSPALISLATPAPVAMPGWTEEGTSLLESVADNKGHSSHVNVAAPPPFALPTARKKAVVEQRVEEALLDALLPSRGPLASTATHQPPASARDAAGPDAAGRSSVARQQALEQVAAREAEGRPAAARPSQRKAAGADGSPAGGAGATEDHNKEANAPAEDMVLGIDSDAASDEVAAAAVAAASAAAASWLPLGLQHDEQEVEPMTRQTDTIALVEDASGAEAEVMAAPAAKQKEVPRLMAQAEKLRSQSTLPALAAHAVGKEVLAAAPGLGAQTPGAVLQQLAYGTLMHKAWHKGVAQATRGSRRVLQCLVEGRLPLLKYPHGWRRKPLRLAVRRVRVSGGAWAPGKTITVETAHGTLLCLTPSTAQDYATWVVGLTAALHAASGAEAAASVAAMPWCGSMIVNQGL